MAEVQAGKPAVGAGVEARASSVHEKSMPIEVGCPACGRVIRAPDTLAGKKVKCPDCKTVVAVPDRSPPAAKPAATRPPVARPAAPSRPAATRPQSPWSGGPSQPPAAPPSFGGVADLIGEELTLEQIRSREQQLADFERQQEEAIRGAYEAPKRAAEALRMKKLHGPYENPKKLDLGRVLARSWEVYKANLGTILVVSWTGWLISAAYMAAIMGVTMGIATVIAGLVADRVPDIEPSWVLIPLLILGFIVGMLVPAWLQAGQTAYLLKLIQGRPTEFADLFREYGRIQAVMGAWLIFQLMQLMPYLAFLPVQFISYLHEERMIRINPPVITMLVGGSMVVFIFLAAVAIVKNIRWMFFLHAMVDVKGGAGDSLENSRLIMTNRNAILMVLAYAAIGLIVVVLGCGTAGVGLIFLAPMATVFMATAFLQMTDRLPVTASLPEAPAEV
jgi:phage FluMu protein Com